MKIGCSNVTAVQKVAILCHKITHILYQFLGHNVEYPRGQFLVPFLGVLTIACNK